MLMKIGLIYVEVDSLVAVLPSRTAVNIEYSLSWHDYSAEGLNKVMNHVF